MAKTPPPSPPLWLPAPKSASEGTTFPQSLALLGVALPGEISAPQAGLPAKCASISSSVLPFVSGKKNAATTK